MPSDGRWQTGPSPHMKDTKDRIVAEGLDLLTRSGFAGVTLGVLAQQTGLSKSGLFAHFGSKSAVQLRLLEEMIQVSQTTVVAPAMAAPAGLPRLRALFERWLGWSGKAGLGGGCPVAAGFFEFDDVDLDDPVRQRLMSMDAEWRAFLKDLASEAVGTGELRDDLDLDQLVWELCGIYLNHHVSLRFIHDPIATDRAMTAYDELVKRGRGRRPAAGTTRSSRRRRR
jgi:AcrR family transcriptional regulator